MNRLTALLILTITALTFLTAALLLNSRGDSSTPLSSPVKTTHDTALHRSGGSASPRASRTRTTPATSLRLNWTALAQCESGGNPRAVSPDGQYRGMWQFDLSTWRSVGGVGDPALASVAEQWMRAQLLYRRRGGEPWPRCSNHLRSTR